MRHAARGQRLEGSCFAAASCSGCDGASCNLLRARAQRWAASSQSALADGAFRAHARSSMQFCRLCSAKSASRLQHRRRLLERLALLVPPAVAAVWLHRISSCSARGLSTLRQPPRARAQVRLPTEPSELIYDLACFSAGPAPERALENCSVAMDLARCGALDVDRVSELFANATSATFCMRKLAGVAFAKSLMRIDI